MKIIIITKIKYDKVVRRLDFHSLLSKKTMLSQGKVIMYSRRWADNLNTIS